MMKRTAIFIALLCVCIRMCAAMTYSGTLPATTTHLVGSETKTFLDLTNCTTNATITEGSIGTFAMGLYYILGTLKPAWASGDEYNNVGITTQATTFGFLKSTDNASYDAYTHAFGYAMIRNTENVVLYVTGITDFAVWGKDYSSTEYLQIKVAEISSDGTVGTESTTESIKSDTQHITQVSSLDGLKFYKITLTSNVGKACHTYQVRFVPCTESRAAAPITWSAKGLVCKMGDSPSYPTLSNSNELAVTYISSNPAVATVDPTTGTVTRVAKGMTTISANYYSTTSDTYKTTAATYKLTISELDAETDRFWKFSDDEWSSYKANNNAQTANNIQFISNGGWNGAIYVVSKTYADESLTFTKGLDTGGESSENNSVLRITVTPDSEVSVYAAAFAESARTLVISTDAYDNKADQSSITTTNENVIKLSHVVDGGGDVYIHNTKKYYILGIKVSPTSQALPEQSVAVGAKGFATYCNSSYALDFTGKSIKAFTISSTDGSTLTLTQKDKVAKGEPVLLYSETSSDSQSIPAIADNEATADSSNKLVAGDGNTHTWVEGITEHYILYSGGATPGFWQANNSRVAVGKAYLDLTSVSAGAPKHFNLEVGGSEATRISATLNNKEQIINNSVYDLQGRCVTKPTKGMYIINGRKVVKR